jgi:hypothetical protein
MDHFQEGFVIFYGPNPKPPNLHIRIIPQTFISVKPFLWALYTLKQGLSSPKPYKKISQNQEKLWIFRNKNI